MHGVSFHPSALLVTIPFLLLLWSAADLRWTVAVALAVVVYDVLSFAGVFGLSRR